MDLLDGRVARELPEDTSIPSSDHQHPSGGRVESPDRKVSDHFLVGMFVALSGLDDSVEQEDLAIRLGGHHHHVLEVRAGIVQDLVVL